MNITVHRRPSDLLKSGNNPISRLLRCSNGNKMHTKFDFCRWPQGVFHSSGSPSHLITVPHSRPRVALYFIIITYDVLLLYPCLEIREAIVFAYSAPTMNPYTLQTLILWVEETLQSADQNANQKKKNGDPETWFSCYGGGCCVYPAEVYCNCTKTNR